MNFPLEPGREWTIRIRFGSIRQVRIRVISSAIRTAG